MKNLSSIGLSPKDETVLKALTDLLGARTREDWVYSAPEAADVVLLDTDNPEAVTAWKQTGQDDRCTTIAYSASSPDLPLNRRLNKPLRAADLIAILNGLSDPVLAGGHAQGDRTVATLADATTGSVAQQVSDCASGYLKISAGTDYVVFNRSNDTCTTAAAAANLPGLFALPAAELIIESSAEAFVEVASGHEWRNAQSLLWWVGLHGSEGRLLQHLDPSSNFKLVRWPPPALIKSSQQYFNLCALLSRKSGITVADIQALTRLPEGEVVAFLNAAALFGILRTRLAASEPVAVVRERPAANKSLFEKIRSRLKK
ncbi:hypothetical protein [Marinobacter sp. SS21]|uniref:hypothetical protein n=1 Tax=Marinobacter sp. SS21 TaxID=2979460 RepID=UPI00232D5511|nr:hypothetical protein [Marinobacter sp. SS21]MDC0662330.1 hypothetical protein [Marinobacter sp. SS21]